MKRIRSLLCIFVIFLSGGLAGCGTLPNGRTWGQDVTLTPGWRRLAESAHHAFLTPDVIAPAIAAGLLQIDHADERLSDWAVEHTPLFGSPHNARVASDYGYILAETAYGVSIIAAPGGADRSEWVWSKCKGAAIGLIAHQISHDMTGLLKDHTKRKRPHQSAQSSFPSGHVSGVAVNSSMAMKNLDLVPLSTCSRILMKTGLYALTLATAWARVEGNRHYPADGLAGMALGNMMGAFFTEAFLGLERQPGMRVTVKPDMKGVFLQISWGF